MKRKKWNEKCNGMGSARKGEEMEKIRGNGKGEKGERERGRKR